MNLLTGIWHWHRSTTSQEKNRIEMEINHMIGTFLDQVSWKGAILTLLKGMGYVLAFVAVLALGYAMLCVSMAF